MATTGHESEAINVQGLKASLQKFKTDKVDGKAEKTATVSTVSYDTTNKKLTKTINGTTSDIVSTAKLKTDMSLSKSDVGLNNVGNFKAVSTVASQGLSDTEKANARANIGAGTSSLTLGTGASNAYYGDKGKTAYDHSQSTHARTDATKVEASSTNGNIKINGTETTVYTHPSGTNPHGTTKSDVGLGNVTNDSQVKRAEMGTANGVATLDSAGKVPSSQLPSYVDDVLEYDTKSAFPTTGEAGKIYVDKSNNTTWRWSGTAYTQIKGDLVIGTTTGTAADGGIANTHYNNTSNPHSVTKAQVGLGSVVNTGDSATPVSGGTTKFTTGGAYTELAKKVDKVTGKGLSTNDYTTDEKNKLSGIASGAEVNQNAFSNVAVGNTTISADGKTDTLTLVAGSNVTITPDATNDKVTIAATDTTYSAATTSAAGLMSADDKTKLNGIATGATKVTTDTVAGWGYTKNAGTVTGVKINGTTKSPSSGVVDLGTVITSHQDISGKVNTSTKVNGHALTGDVTVTKSDVGLGDVGNFKAVSTVASQGLSDTEKANARANIGAGTSSFSGSYNDLSNKPTIPAAAANGTYTVKTLVGSTTTNVSDFTANQSSADDVTFVQGSNVTITPDATNRKITIAATDTTYSSKSAASGGTDVSLVTTGEKYTWNNKSNFSGSYNDLSNKPTIPAAANNGTFSIKTKVGTANAVTAADFTANQSTADDITLIQGTNVTLTTDTTNRTITIAATDTTYSPLSLGFCYGECSTAAGTAAKTVTMGSYNLVAHGIVSIRFTNAITVANATLNINSKGAKAIYYKGAALGANIVGAGSIVVMQYNGSQYHIVSIEAPIITTSEIDTLLAD